MNHHEEGTSETRAPKTYGDISIVDSAAVLGDVYGSLHLHTNQRENRVRELLDSLWYAEINARRNEIRVNHAHTFEWVFDDDDNLPKRATGVISFPRWCRGNGRVFLVEGKAGSGKSTFMKFLLAHDSTRTALTSWAETKQLCLLFHGFWRPGTKIQNSFRGFMASLLYQLISLGVQPSSEPEKHFPKRSIHDWSETELRVSLLTTLQQTEAYLCIFVDGLDEFDENDDIDRLLSTIAEMTRFWNCRFVVSSRPVGHILGHYSRAPSICLQERIGQDLERYITDTLQQKLSSRHQLAEQRSQLETLVGLMCEKSEGVFIWVHYVLQTVCKGLRVFDDLPSLEKRIRALPTGMTQLYREMWQINNENNQIYMEESSRIFGLGHRFPMPLFRLATAVDTDLRTRYLCREPKPDVEYLDKHLDTFARKFDVRTAGLVELILDRVEFRKQFLLHGGDPTAKLWRPNINWRGAKVQYFHRTVHDFVQDHGVELGIVPAQAWSSDETNLSLFESYLACCIERISFTLTSGALSSWLQKQALLKPVPLDVLFYLNYVGDWISRRDGYVQNIRGSDWVGSLEPSRGVYDYPSLIISHSPQAVQLFLRTYGSDWTDHYKAFLAFTLAIRIRDSSIESRVRVKLCRCLAVLANAGVELFCFFRYLDPEFGSSIITSTWQILLAELFTLFMRPHSTLDEIVAVSLLLARFKEQRSPDIRLSLYLSIVSATSFEWSFIRNAEHHIAICLQPWQMRRIVLEVCSGCIVAAGHAPEDLGGRFAFTSSSRLDSSLNDFHLAEIKASFRRQCDRLSIPMYLLQPSRHKTAFRQWILPSTTANLVKNLITYPDLDIDLKLKNLLENVILASDGQLIDSLAREAAVKKYANEHGIRMVGSSSTLSTIIIRKLPYVPEFPSICDRFPGPDDLDVLPSSEERVFMPPRRLRPTRAVENLRSLKANSSLGRQGYLLASRSGGITQYY